MKKSSRTYTTFQKITSIFLMLTLLWLTVSTPFIYTAQQEIAKQQKMQAADSPITACEDETTDSGSNNNAEEKVPTSSNSLSEEYLHDHHHAHYIFAIKLSYQKSGNSNTYIAYHGELHVPPPNAA